MEISSPCRYRTTLLDHLVGPSEQGRRNIDPELLGRFEIDDQLEPGRLHDRKFRRLFTFKDTADIDTCLPPCVRQVGTVAEETSGNGVHATVADRWNSVAVGLCDVQASTAEAEQGIGAGKKRAYLQSAHRCESLVELALAEGVDDMKGQPQGLSGCFCFVDLAFGKRPFRVHQQGNG